MVRWDKGAGNFILELEEGAENGKVLNSQNVRQLLKNTTLDQVQQVIEDMQISSHSLKKQLLQIKSVIDS